MAVKKRINIAIIEDDPIMAEMIQDNLFLKFPSATTTIFPTGELALEKIVTPPDMIILDYQLDSIQPDAMDGLQVLAKLKKILSSRMNWPFKNLN